ncbi:MAG: serine/threonine-protein kinase, partial [Acidobacteriota bacterium]
MSVADWQRLGDIFQRALEQPESSRKDFLQGASGGDADMVQTIEDLLEADGEVGEFLENPLLARPPRELTAGDDDEPLPNGGQIDKYRLQRKIGEGGMSSVYLAARDEDGFRRRVAIKIIRRGMESDDALRRFRAESQILSSLDHPYIARLYDGGMVGNEVPYFAMEYVDGVPIDVYCERHRLGVTERIELFRKVCDAIHYSHRNLVVHRDIKPSNILVTSDGVPKLLDFGIAKLLNPELSAPSLESTVTWMRILTPQYASPEQVRGEMITTSSDIYSLGVLLFKLLTGDLPFQFEGKSSSDVERALTESEPPRPSHRVKEKTGASATGTTTAAAGAGDLAAVEVLSRQLAGDLDDIVLKAIRAVPEHRYPSAEQLSEDLERHLAGFPVLARKGSLRYSAGRFLRRHWLAVGGSAAALLVIT